MHTNLDIKANDEERQKIQAAVLEAKRLKNVPINAPRISILNNFPDKYTDRPLLFKDVGIVYLRKIEDADFYGIHVQDNSSDASTVYISETQITFVVNQVTAQWLSPLLNDQQYRKFAYLVASVQRYQNGSIHGWVACVRAIYSLDGSGFGEEVFNSVGLK